MRTRTLKIPQGKPCFIVTPAGVIEVTRGVEDGRSFCFKLPDSCDVVKSLDKLAGRTDLPVRVVDNQVVPAYDILVPVVNATTGELIDAVVPKALRIAVKEELKDEQHKPVSNVADHAGGNGVGHAPDGLQTGGPDSGGQGEDDGCPPGHSDHAEGVRD